jgi:diguanylate cyclase (GGDEF)-like protein
MDAFLRIDVNLAAMVLLGIVCLIAWRRLDLSDQLNKVFMISSVIIILELFFESATCVLNRRPESWAAPVSTLMHLFLFGAAPILTYFWYRMLSHWIFPDEKISRRKQVLLLLPVVVNLILTLMSPLYRLIFYIDGSNVYHRGPYFFLSVVIIYSYFLYSFALILTQRKKVVKEEFIPLFIVGILPVIGGILQSVFYGLLMMWSFAGFSLVVVYIFLQQRMVHLDDLTGAWTRGTFEYCLAQRAKRRKDDVFGLVLLDIDGLKKINDEYGHFEGDYALKTIVQLIKSVLKKTDVIARTGGDEFLIILDCNTREKVEHTIEKIKSTLRLHNETSSKDYLLDCSIGAELFHSGFTDIDQFMRHVDKLMYENKRIKKCG